MRAYAKFLFLGILIFYFAHLIYWKGYWKPEAFIWDENYHVASAARYLKGVFFMEPHPPLGKLILALGEKIVAINNNSTFSFERADIISPQNLSISFSFAGYRFFPALFSVFNILLFAACAFTISRSYLQTALAAAFPLLDSALILHARAAMLEPFLIFGHLLCILGFLTLLKAENPSRKKLFWGVGIMSFGLFFAAMTKVFGLALLVLWPMLYWYRARERKFLNWAFLGHGIFAFLLSFAVWTLHVQLGKKIDVQLLNNGSYYASDRYERWILGHEKDSVWNIPTKIYENIRFMIHYERNVSELDYSDPNITGSYAIQWPFGSRPIAYRWQRRSDQHAYLYLIPNHWAWAAGLGAILLAAALLIRRGRKCLVTRPEIPSLLLLYFAYFLPMCFIWRVLYLYHYFPMLFISWLLLVPVLSHLFEAWSGRKQVLLQIAVCAFPLLLFQGYYFNKDFIYFRERDCQYWESKKLFPFWGLKFPSCNQEKMEYFFQQQFRGRVP